METFTISGGQFLLNDRPFFVHAAEFHYFRTPADQWHHRLSLLQDCGFNTLALYIPWLWHEVEQGQFDLDGHSHPMRNLAGFLDLAAEMGFYLIPRPGPYIMAETINEGIPPWVFATYPQAMFVTQNGESQNIASYLQPDFLACVTNWYRAVFGVLAPRQLSRGGKIIITQLDNEMGMIQWVRNIIDTNPHTLERFGGYLQERYGEALSERYPTANLPGFLREEILHPSETYSDPLLTDYRCFYRAYLREYATFLLDTARGFGFDGLPVINIHGFGNGGRTFPIGISQLLDVMRIEGVLSATDVYPLRIHDGNFHEMVLVNEMTKALHNPDQALFSIEFQSGGNHDFGNGQLSLYDLHSRLCISNGMRAINHYLFFGGENHPVLSPVRRHDWGPPVRIDGSVRNHYHRYGELSAMLNAYGQALITARPQTVTTIGFSIDHYRTEVNNAFTQKSTDLLTLMRDNILFEAFGKALAITHRPFNALELASAPLDPAQTPTLWTMLTSQCPRHIQQKLMDYLNAGGRLVLAGRLPVEDETRAPCTLLLEALDVEIGTSDPMPYPFWHTTDITVFGHDDIPARFIESYSGAFDEVFATRASGEVVGFRKQVGAGFALVLGATVSAHTLVDIGLYDQMAEILGIPRLLTMQTWLDARISRGEQGSFLFLNNYQDDPYTTTLALHGQPLFGGHPITLAAHRGMVLPLDWQPAPGVTIHYATSEIKAVRQEGDTLLLETVQPEFVAELSLQGYTCEAAETIPGSTRLLLRGQNGRITILRFA